MCIAHTHRPGDRAQLALELVAAKRDRRGVAAPAHGKRELLIPQRMRAQLCRIVIGLLVQRDQLLRIAIHHRQQCVQNFVVARHARLVVLQHVQLDEHRGPVLQHHEAVREARRQRAERQPLRGVGLVIQVQQMRKREMLCSVHLALKLGCHIFTNPLRRRRRNIRRVVDGEGHVILKIRSVGHVVVDKEIRQPAMKHLQKRPRLRRIGLHVVAGSG